MRKKTQTQKQKPSPDALLKTGKKGEIEFAEKDLEKVSGGGSHKFNDAVAGDLSATVKFKFTTI